MLSRALSGVDKCSSLNCQVSFRNQLSPKFKNHIPEDEGVKLAERMAKESAKEINKKLVRLAKGK